MKVSTPSPISNEVVSDMRTLVESGAGRAEVVASMRSAGLHIVECIKLTRSLYGLTLGDAKAVVHESEAWADCRDRNDALHEQAMEAVEEDGWTVSERSETKAVSTTAA